MTDAEKELRRKAQAAHDGGWHEKSDLFDELEAKDVLALLDRIEALEKQVGDSERKGAEEMREKLTGHFDALADDARRQEGRFRENPSDTMAWSWTRLTFERCASDSKRWPLPGDAP